MNQDLLHDALLRGFESVASAIRALVPDRNPPPARVQFYDRYVLARVAARPHLAERGKELYEQAGALWEARRAYMLEHLDELFPRPAPERRFRSRAEFERLRTSLPYDNFGEDPFNDELFADGRGKEKP